MSDAYWVNDLPDVTSPVLVVALEGWIDAAQAAQTAMQAIIAGSEAKPAVTFDPDLFLDYRARRPTTHLRDGVVVGMTWPATVVSHGRDVEGSDILLLHGAEPDSSWRRFLDACDELIERFQVRLVLGLGAYPVAVPHTRPSRVIATSSERELALKVGVVNVALDLPGGLATALEVRCAAKGVPAIGLWAQIPHYATGMPYSAGALSLIETVNGVAGLRLGTEALRAAAGAQRSQLDQLIGNSAEHEAMVRAMEQQYDAEAPETSGSAPAVGEGLGEIPSGDELAAELERFLREQGDTGA